MNGEKDTESFSVDSPMYNNESRGMEDTSEVDTSVQVGNLLDSEGGSVDVGMFDKDENTVDVMGNETDIMEDVDGQGKEYNTEKRTHKSPIPHEASSPSSKSVNGNSHLPSTPLSLNSIGLHDGRGEEKDDANPAKRRKVQ